jgi:hypothetical protein
MRTLYSDIKAAASTGEPWSEVAKVLADFPAIYHQEQRQVKLIRIELRELELGENGLCSFVFYWEDAEGNFVGIMDFVEFDIPQIQNAASLKAINRSTAVARAQRLLTIAAINNLHLKETL